MNFSGNDTSSDECNKIVWASCIVWHLVDSDDIDLDNDNEFITILKLRYQTINSKYSSSNIYFFKPFNLQKGNKGYTI